MSIDQERIQISPKLEESFFNSNTGVHESSPPVDFKGEPIDVVLPMGSEDVCKHHWLIDTPLGQTSQGTCKHCGEQQAFKNSKSNSFQEDGRPGKMWRSHSNGYINGNEEENDN